MDGTGPSITALRAEKLRSVWGHAVADVDLHRQRHLALLAVFVTVGLTAVASAAVGQVHVVGGLAIGTLMLGASAYVHLQFRALPGRLKAALEARIGGLDSLISQEVR